MRQDVAEKTLFMSFSEGLSIKQIDLMSGIWDRVIPAKRGQMRTFLKAIQSKLVLSKVDAGKPVVNDLLLAAAGFLDAVIKEAVQQALPADIAIDGPSRFKGDLQAPLKRLRQKCRRLKSDSLLREGERGPWQGHLTSRRHRGSQASGATQS